MMWYDWTGYATAGCVVLGLLGGAIACAEPQHSTEGQAQATEVAKDLGACKEIDFTPLNRGDVVPGHTITETGDYSKVAVKSLGSNSKILVTGNNSCVYVAGDVASTSVIEVTGDDSAIVVRGVVESTPYIAIIGDREVMTFDH